MTATAILKMGLLLSRLAFLLSFFCCYDSLRDLPSRSALEEMRVLTGIVQVDRCRKAVFMEFTRMTDTVKRLDMVEELTKQGFSNFKTRSRGRFDLEVSNSCSLVVLPVMLFLSQLILPFLA